MENASQALLIAGGILIGILTITLLVYMFGNLATIETARDEESNLKRIEEWNAEWESYNKKYLYGAEVLTVINKAEESNKSSGYNVKVEVYDENNRLKYSSDGKGNKDFLYNNRDERNRIYTCVKMENNGTEGRVSYIEFKFVE